MPINRKNKAQPHITESPIIEPSLQKTGRPTPPERPPLNRRALNSRAKLAAALAQTRAELRSGPSADVRLELEQEEDFLLEWSEQYERNILERKRALREKKAAARWQRMSGPR